MPRRRLIPYRNYNSDTATIAMPTGYENSAMKMSFSLSSLQPSSASLESPDHARMRAERPYNSLKKKSRKDLDQETWRRSWGSREDNKDEFWAALQPNYNYLMDNHLIDSCNEATGELRGDNDEMTTTTCINDASFLSELNQIKNQFTELYAWLSNVQDGVYGKEECLTDRSLRVSHMEEMQRNSHLRESFNAKSAVLLEKSPRMNDEVSWRVSHLNSKWEMLEQVLTPVKSDPGQLDASTDVEHEVRCLRKWLSEMEARLQPLDFRTTDRWTQFELEEKAREHMVLQRDVESHGKIVCSVVKLCERLARTKSRRGRRHDALGVARSLESRWHHLYLRSLEWSCMIEALADKLRNNSPSLVSTDSDEGPASKYPRLSQSLDQRSSSSSTSSTSDVERRHDVPTSDDDVNDEAVMDTSPATPHVNMVAPTLCEAKGKKRRGGSGSDREKTSARMNGGGGVEFEGFIHKADGSIFNRTFRDAPNYASYYFKHQDTDSEQDARKAGLLEANMTGGSGNEKSLEESSEEEWTFTNGNIGKQETSGSSSETTASSTRRALRKSVANCLDFSADSMDEKDMSLLVNNDINQKCETSWEIQRLVTLADEMVVLPRKTAATRARVFPPLVFDVMQDAKTARINEWLKLNPTLHDGVDAVVTECPVDSCDASGEYTTGDDDKDSQSSEDANETTCRQVLGCSRSCSSDAILEDASQDDTTSPLRTPNHVVLRPRRRQTADRPWSVSGLPQLELTEPLSHFSISESALHQMVVGSPQGKGPRLSGSTLMNMSSSTIDGTPVNGDPGSGSRAGSLRRRKLRPKKRTMGRKSESGSDGVTVSNSAGSDTPFNTTPQKNIGNIISQETGRQVKTSRHTSDSMLRESSSEEEERISRRPSFKLGPEVGSVSYHVETRIVSEENHSSLSEQAWDSYQEKYMSEPYSEEPPDSETARRLLEFGDDYSKYIGSQSDCPSSLCSSNQMASPVMRRRKPVGVVYPSYAMDSDSDVEEIRHVIGQSRSQLNISESVFNNQLLTASALIRLDKDFAELIATCRENIKALNMLLSNVGHEDGGLISARDCKEMRGLVERWEMLQANSEDLRRVRALQREMVDLKDDLQNLASRVDGMEINLQDREQLEARITQTKAELASLKERKAKLLDVNVAVHRFQTDTGFPTPVLKDNVADLYRIWDETYNSVSQRLVNLQHVSTTWQQFDAHLGELQVALRGDQHTLHMLDTALQGGQDVATSVMDVAKVLSEKQERYHEAICKNPTLLDDSTSGSNTTLTSVATLGTEGGSLSDSGISDEGSEQELSERERRLEALRRLARHLEGVLAPGSAVLDNMAKRIAQTESDLRSLQRTCRDLIVRTAVCVDARSSPCVVDHVATPPCAAAPPPYSQGLRAKSQPRSRKTSTSRRQMLGVHVGSPDDDSDPDKRRSWLWRVIRAALPFQMALVALFCVACLLEPHCCDAMNNLNLSLTPQLRYLRGPPPV